LSLGIRTGQHARVVGQKDATAARTLRPRQGSGRPCRAALLSIAPANTPRVVGDQWQHCASDMSEHCHDRTTNMGLHVEHLAVVDQPCEHGSGWDRGGGGRGDQLEDVNLASPTVRTITKRWLFPAVEGKWARYRRARPIASTFVGHHVVHHTPVSTATRGPPEHLLGDVLPCCRDFTSGGPAAKIDAVRSSPRSRTRGR